MSGKSFRGEKHGACSNLLRKRFMRLWAKFAAGLITTGLGLHTILYMSAAILRPELALEPITYDPEVLDYTRKLQDTSFDPDDLPTVYREVDHAEGNRADWYPKGESPILAELVNEGRLPPVAERVGEEPLVLEGVDGVGEYGGTWFRVDTAEHGPGGVMRWRLSASNLVRWSPLGYPIVPHVAKGWEVSKDRRVWTFFLRKGMKWSDGHPFTADDILYWWERHVPVIRAAPPEWMVVEGQPGMVEKIDRYTVRFRFPLPNGFLLERLAGAWESNAAPRHYLAAYHPESGNEALIKSTLEVKNFASSRSLYVHLANVDFYNPQHPRLWPWVCRSYTANAPRLFVRNPYYWAVDTEGNQLPYVDRIQFDVMSQKLVPVAAASGNLTMQMRHLRFDEYTLLMSQREKGGYEVYHWFPANRSVWTIWPNLNRRVDPAKPETRKKQALLNDVRFRRALSIAIDRRQIIEAVYNGVGKPAQTSPGRLSPFHHEAHLKSFTAHEPERANALLDEIGLTRRDAEGFRTFRDGSRMIWYMDYQRLTGRGPAQFVVDDWAAVGIRAVDRERSGRLYHVERLARMHDFTIQVGAMEFNPLVQCRSFVPVNSEANFAIGYASWYRQGGLYGNPGAVRLGGIEPPKGHPLRRAMEVLDASWRAPTRNEQRAVFREVLDIAAANVWSISIATPPPQVVVVKRGFKGVPTNAICGFYYGTPANAGVENFFFDSPDATAPHSPETRARIKSEMVMTDPAAESSASAKDESPGARFLGKLLPYCFTAAFIALIMLAAAKHPLIGRRLAIMVPTLLVISIVSFTIIQLPPGNFVESKIAQLQLSGDANSLADIEDLRRNFFLDEPLYQRYLRWMGFYWFVSYETGDAGLLQGNMGRSMETSRPVNEIVGDRLLLTLLISLGTVLFTWALALPIGIYSAVRQYSFGDYLFSLIGFVGMCVPNFLLALILMYLGSQWLGLPMGGLFSPEFAAQAEWNWEKVADLLKHIWVPIVVLGTGGTATMIRVMRGNLLDELKKPYVSFAMARGVRPLRLLMKYPVRIAISPFVSGLGSIFPQLVSGGAIVALVLSLPTVSPLMLQAFLTEDMYLAGSMLMVLSLLGVCGTLVSDLLLLALDPRIRMAGSKR